jgi:hypothetical protein
MSYHGNTLGALALARHVPRRKPYLPILHSDVFHSVSPCYKYRYSTAEESDEEYVSRLAAELEAKFQGELRLESRPNSASPNPQLTRPRSIQSSDPALLLPSSPRPSSEPPLDAPLPCQATSRPSARSATDTALSCASTRSCAALDGRVRCMHGSGRESSPIFRHVGREWLEGEFR